MRKWTFWLPVIGAWIAVSAVAWAADSVKSLRDVLYERFQPSQIEFERPGHRGVLIRRGKVLVLAIDGMPAKPFRGAPVQVMDFALVEVAVDGAVTAELGPLTLSAGTRLVVLELQIKGDRVHLLTHTADPLPDASAGPVYGCTEFVFRVGPRELSAGPFEPLVERIERLLTWTPVERVCATGNRQLCIEP